MFRFYSENNAVTFVQCAPRTDCNDCVQLECDQLQEGEQRAVPQCSGGTFGGVLFLSHPQSHRPPARGGDLGLHRHFRNPQQPFGSRALLPLQGSAISHQLFASEYLLEWSPGLRVGHAVQLRREHSRAMAHRRQWMCVVRLCQLVVRWVFCRTNCLSTVL